MKRSIMKFKGELLVVDRLVTLMESNFETPERKKMFLENALNQAIDQKYKADAFDIKIEVEE